MGIFEFLFSGFGSERLEMPFVLVIVCFYFIKRCFD